MKTIHKYPLEIVDVQSINTFEGFEPLCVQNQRGIMCLWGKVDTHQPKTRKIIYVHGTGHPILRQEADYIGSVQQHEGQLVWHVFMEK